MIETAENIFTLAKYFLRVAAIGSVPWHDARGILRHEDHKYTRAFRSNPDLHFSVSDFLEMDGKPPDIKELRHRHKRI